MKGFVDFFFLLSRFIEELTREYELHTMFGWQKSEVNMRGTRRGFISYYINNVSANVFYDNISTKFDCFMIFIP